MSENKKKAAIIAAVKKVVQQIEKANNKQNNALSNQPEAWTQWGKQITMLNRNNVQRRVK